MNFADKAQSSGSLKADLFVPPTHTTEIHQITSLHTRHGSPGPAGFGPTRSTHSPHLSPTGQAKRNVCSLLGPWVLQGAHRHGPSPEHKDRQDPPGPGPGSRRASLLDLIPDSDSFIVASLIRIIDLCVHTPGWSITCGRNHPASQGDGTKVRGAWPWPKIFVLVGNGSHRMDSRFRSPGRMLSEIKEVVPMSSASAARRPS